MSDDGPDRPGTAPVTAFVDTNLLLHYLPPAQVDWLDLLKADSVAVQIEPVVVRELNKQKGESRSPKIRSRAASVLRELGRRTEALEQSKLRDAVCLRIGTTEPTIDFAQRGLDHRTRDAVSAGPRGPVDGTIEEALP